MEEYSEPGNMPISVSPPNIWTRNKGKQWWKAIIFSTYGTPGSEYIHEKYKFTKTLDTPEKLT